MERLKGPGDLLLRVALAFGLVVGHAWVWQPIREVVAALVAGPLLRWVASDAVVSAVVVPAGARYVELLRVGGQSVTYDVPGGLFFLIPGVFLALVAPRRWYWLMLLVALLGLGVLDFLAVVAGAAWGHAGFVAHEFVRHYMIRPLSIGIPLVLVYGAGLRRAGRSGEDAAVRPA